MTIMPGTAFQVTIPGAVGVRDPLELWVPPFERGDRGPTQAGVLWSATLPEQPAQARELLDQRARSLRDSIQAEPLVEQRLERLLRERELRDRPPSGSWRQERGIEGRADLLIDQEEAPSFGESQDTGLVVSALEVTEFLSQVHLVLSSFALIRPSLGERELGWTRVRWSGDTETLLPRACPSNLASLHARMVAQVLATRQSWVRIAANTVRFAIRLGLLSTTGVGGLLLLPEAYRFIRDSTREIRDLIALGRHPCEQQHNQKE